MGKINLIVWALIGVVLYQALNYAIPALGIAFPYDLVVVFVIFSILGLIIKSIYPQKR